MKRTTDEDGVNNFAHIFTLIIKTVNPRINGDESFDIIKDFLMMVAEGEEIAPEDAINYGHAILTTMPSVSREIN